MGKILTYLRDLSVHTHKAISFIAMIAGAVIGWVSCQFSDDINIVIVLCFVVMIGGILWHIVFVRCPHCGHHFNPRASISNFCPECGKKLE